MNNNYNPYFNYPNMNMRYVPNYFQSSSPSIMGNVSRSPGLFSGLTRSPGLFNPGTIGTAGAGAGAAAKTFSFSGLLNGASKTLGVINQAIPVVYQIKPIWNNAKTMFRVAKVMNSKDEKTNNQVNNEKTTYSNNNNNNYSTNNNNESGPTFFA